ncbi:MAG: transglycosylase SLT domain-containing protein [Sandaracinaceae bacterium]|nr:transglycosylase SLT domain-containing protein [Sandaracinaceae bacterium]
MVTSGAIRAALAAMAATVATCGAPEPSPTPAGRAGAERPREAAPAEPARADAAFDPDVVRRDPSTAAGQILAALDAGEPERAAALATAALAAPNGEDVHRLRWLSARASQAAGRPGQASATLAHVADSEHALAPWARLWRARLAMDSDPARAADEVAPLTALEWAGREPARELQAAALVAAGRAEEAEPLLRALLAAASPDTAAAAVAMPLAELLAAREEAAAKAEAIALWRRVATRAPLSSVAREAEARVAAVLPALPASERRRLADPSPEDGFARASALAAAVQFAEAEQAFADVAARTRDDGLACRARLGQGRAIYFRRQRRRAAELLVQVGRECEAAEVRAWAYYLAGRGFRSAGEDELALAQYARLEATTPEHSLADDARYQAALIDGELGREERMVEKLTALPTDYPAGDMRGRARFMLAWRARRAGDLQGSLTHLTALAADGAGEDREDLAGRAEYWRGRVLAELGRGDEATEAFTAVVRDAPLSYFAQQALARLEATDEASATAARALLGARGDGAIRFPWRAVFDSDAFARAIALLSVGEVSDAERELAWLEARDGDDELRWVHAALLDRAGEHYRAVNLTRRQLRDFMREPPAGAHFARWRIAFPRAYAGFIETAAAESPVPAELIFAIAREESSFHPGVVSTAQAYGLTQLLVPTARRFARPLGIAAPTAVTLRDPAINVRVGAAYMGWLWRRYEGNPVVLPSAYNAGQGATDRWLRERPQQSLDEWIEDIPYDETRRYTRRVLQTWGVYTWLDHGRLPELAARLPTR